MSVNINKLDDYSLILIFNLLNVREKIAIERVCKKWYEIIEHLLNGQKGLKLARIPQWMGCKDSNHSTNGGDVCDFLNYPNDKYKVKKILIILFRKCPNIKCIELKLSSLELKTCIRIFSWFLWLCPNLECLRVYINDNKIIRGFGEAIELMGTQVTHFCVYQSSNWMTSPNSINELINKMPNLQRLALLGFHNSMSFPIKFGRNLRELITDCFSKENIDEIISCKAIDKLEIFGVLDQLAFQTICHQMPQLKQLIARFKESVYDFSALTQIKNLQSFGFSNINFYDLKDISSSKMVFSKKNQIFSDLKKSSDALLNILSVKEMFISLRSFSLYGISISAKMLETICEELPKIECLLLNKCCFYCECNKKKQNCKDCQEECGRILSHWPNLRGLTCDHPDNEVLIQHLPKFSHLRNITINHVKLYPNNRFYLNGIKAWTHCMPIFNSSYLMASQTKDRIKVNLNIHLENVIRVDIKTPKNLLINFNYFSNSY